MAQYEGVGCAAPQMGAEHPAQSRSSAGAAFPAEPTGKHSDTGWSGA